MRRSAIVLCIGLAAAFDAPASTFSTDASDLWYAAPAESESGWGVNVSQQGATLFVTMFVYGSNSQPTWFVGPDTAFTGTSGNPAVFNGPLYATRGSPFAAPWNANAKSHRQVGTVTFSLTSSTTATLSYTVDGVKVHKNLVRQTWKFNDLTGQYIGGVAGTFSRCADPTVNGFTTEYASIAVTHQGPSISIDLENSRGAGSCSYNGTYSQAGRMGSIAGNYTCTGGVVGTFTATEVEAGLSGFTARMQETSNTCSWSGRVGGIRSTP